MNDIRIINNLISGEWDTQINLVEYNYFNLYIGFTNNEPVTYFNNLSFGYEFITPNGNINETYPSENVIYDSSDETFLTIDTFYIQPSTNYTLNYWAENGGVRTTGQLNFTSPVLPPQPTPTPSGTTFN
jgi:hypothetical protein